MESSLDDLKYPPSSSSSSPSSSTSFSSFSFSSSSSQRGRQDTQAYNQESDCSLYYRRHHSSWGERKQKHYRVPRQLCHRSSHTDMMRPPHQRPGHSHTPHLPKQQHQQNNSNSTPTTNPTNANNANNASSNNNNNNNRKSETISSHGVKCPKQTPQQAATANRRSVPPSSTPRRASNRVGGSGFEQCTPLQCRVDIYSEHGDESINQESGINFTNSRLKPPHLRRQHSDPGTYQQQRQQHESPSCNEHPIYPRLVPRRRRESKPNLCTQKQLKLKDKNITLGACPLECQSQSTCDCPRGGWDAHRAFYFPRQINLEKTQGKKPEAIRINDEDKEILDKDFVMGGRETSVLPWRIIRDQTDHPRPGHTDINHSDIGNGGREIRTAVEFATAAQELADPELSGVGFQNRNESNACRTRLGNKNSCTMSNITRKEYNDKVETNSVQTTLSINSKSRGQIPAQQNKALCNYRETQIETSPEKDINTNTRDNHKLKISTIRNFGRNTNAGSETRDNTIYKTESNLCANNFFLSLGRFVAGSNIRVFFFIFFIGCALQCTSPGAGRCYASWLIPGADAKSVLSLSKNVLMTDADSNNKHVASESTFNDFPDIDSDNGDGPADKGNADDGSSTGTGNRNGKDSGEQKESLDEYEAYDDSTGEDPNAATGSNGEIRNPETENSEQNSDNHVQYSDQSDDEIADSIDEEEYDYEDDDDEDEDEEDEDDEEEDDDDDDEDWAGDMSSQPLFLPPGMEVDGGHAGVGATGKHSTDQETPPMSEEPERQIPEYMLKLYQKFTQKHYIHPASDTVRSFSNINDDILFNISNGNELPGAKTRYHTLSFNISSFPGGERINLAHLRLYKLVERDRNRYVGDDRKVSVYEVITYNNGTRQLKLVSQKHIYGRHSGWESFDVTPAVRRWVAEIENGAVQMLEVTIESIFNSVWGNDVDISTEPRNKKEPLLVVFSEQINKRLVHQQERDELLQHDITLSDIEDVDNYTTTEPPLSSESPNGDQADGDKDEDVDDDDDEDSSKEDSYGTIGEMTSYAKVTQSMRSTGKEYQSRPNQKVRVKRSKTSSKRNICRRTKLEVDFSEISGHSWIVAPKKYQAFECSGKCYFPLGEHLRPTKHAIIRANLHVHNKKVTRPCCVPTKLDSISLLYLDPKTNGYTFKYKFEGMKVVECGCR